MSTVKWFLSDADDGASVGASAGPTDAPGAGGGGGGGIPQLSGGDEAGPENGGRTGIAGASTACEYVLCPGKLGQSGDMKEVELSSTAGMGGLREGQDELRGTACGGGMTVCAEVRTGGSSKDARRVVASTGALEESGILAADMAVGDDVLKDCTLLSAEVGCSVLENGTFPDAWLRLARRLARKRDCARRFCSRLRKEIEPSDRLWPRRQVLPELLVSQQVRLLLFLRYLVASDFEHLEKLSGESPETPILPVPR